MNVGDLRKIVTEMIDDVRSDSEIRSQNGARDQLLKSTIEEYIGAPVDSVQSFADPRHAGVWAVRATISGAVEDYVVFNFSPKKSAQEMSGDVSESEFATWPPKSSG